MKKLEGTPQLGKLRKQFKEYITEYDLRRGTNFALTFPQYTWLISS
jgi:hypothetical protein